jgi:hypothetical protein
VNASYAVCVEWMSERQRAAFDVELLHDDRSHADGHVPVSRGTAQLLALLGGPIFPPKPEQEEVSSGADS